MPPRYLQTMVFLKIIGHLGTHIYTHIFINKVFNNSDGAFVDLN